MRGREGGMDLRGEGGWDPWSRSDPPSPTAQVDGGLWATLSPQTSFFGLPEFLEIGKFHRKIEVFSQKT